jgi:hypothetical protein
MIDVHCHDCGRVLVGTRQIVSMTSGEAGIEVAYVCWCGRLGAEVMGRRARREHASTSALGSAGGPSGVRG